MLIDVVPPESLPLGRYRLVPVSIVRTSDRPIPYLLRARGLHSTLTAGSELPPTNTCPTPSIWDSFCWSMVDAASYICSVLVVSEVRARIRTGASAGLIFRYNGLLGRFAGR